VTRTTSCRLSRGQGHAADPGFPRFIADPFQQISIVLRVRSALVYTLQLPTRNQFLLTPMRIGRRLRGLLGGRAAEEIVFSGSSVLASQNILERATLRLVVK